MEYYNGNEIEDLYPLNGSRLSERALGELLTDEYCLSCHRMASKLIGPKLGGLSLADSSLLEILRRPCHVVTNGETVWENKQNFFFIPEDQRKAIVLYLKGFTSVVD